MKALLGNRKAAIFVRLAIVLTLIGSIFAFVRVLDGPPVAELAPLLIREAGVLTIPGTAFGAAGAGHLRLSYGSAPEPVLDEALARLRAFFAHR